jgi:hypothetical protein
VLAVALLAWTTLAFGAPLQTVGVASMDSYSQVSASRTSAVHCDGMSMPVSAMHAAAQRGHAPTMPAGHGDCCHGGCHCASACNAVLTVPRLATLAPVPHAALQIAAPVAPASMPEVPPLRPPIG